MSQSVTDMRRLWSDLGPIISCHQACGVVSIWKRFVSIIKNHQKDYLAYKKTKLSIAVSTHHWEKTRENPNLCKSEFGMESILRSEELGLLIKRGIKSHKPLDSCWWSRCFWGPRQELEHFLLNMHQYCVNVKFRWREPSRGDFIFDSLKLLC